MSSEGVTERFQLLTCPESEKQILRDYLFSCLAEGANYKLKRNRVMIMEQKNKNKFIILELVPTSDENKQMYICPKCSHIDVSNFLTEAVPCEQFESCLHTQLCVIIWGNMVQLHLDILDDEEEDLLEVVTESPQYMAVVHPSNKSSKGPGIVILTSKTLKPKCIVCPGQDCCLHLKIHMAQYKRGLEQDEKTENENKRLRINRLVPVNPQKKNSIDPDKLDPFQHDGPDANVFKVQIDFLRRKDACSSKKVAYKNTFHRKILVAKYDPSERCGHGNKYYEKESIIFMESINIKIHHTAEVETLDKKVLYRPTVRQVDGDCCICKKFFTGEEEELIRVSPTNNKMTGRSNTLHFVSYEYYFSFVSKLIASGETLSGFIKSRKFMDEVYFGLDKSPEYRKVLQKGFEIFCHALKLPEDANFCYQCPQKLEKGEKEDDFDQIEYSIIDGIQMGCRTNDLKAGIKEEYFQEEIVEHLMVKGVEAKDRTFLKTEKVRTIISDLVADMADTTALPNAVKALNLLELDENATSVLELLNRILSERKVVPPGYHKLLHELSLKTPISALMVPYSSDRMTYKRFLEYLNNEEDIFSNPSDIWKFINKIPIVIESVKNIMEEENLTRTKHNVFLPTDVSVIFKNMVKLRFEFDKLSRQVAVPRVSPESKFVPPKADFSLSYPIHTMENEYKADKKPDSSILLPLYLVALGQFHVIIRLLRDSEP